VGEPGRYLQFLLSPDETRVAVERTNEGNTDVWILELASGIFSRLTFGPFREGGPSWSPDSHRIAVSVQDPGKQEIQEIAVASGAATVLYADGNMKYLEDWTPDGRYLIYRVDGRVAYRLPLSGERRPEAILKSSFAIDEFEVSPDGRWIAYQSDESGKTEVYIGSFPTFDQKRLVSSGGGCQPMWRKDGKELYYLTLDGKMMAAEVQAGASLQTGLPKLLFETAIGLGGNRSQLNLYAVTGDGKKFLVIEPVRQSQAGTAAADQFHLVLNWPAELKP
jgi:Tol biopolymer transport system component